MKVEASSASEENSSRSVKRMSLSLPGNGYGNTFADKREKNRTKGYMSTFVYVFQSCINENIRKTFYGISN